VVGRDVVHWQIVEIAVEIILRARGLVIVGLPVLLLLPGRQAGHDALLLLARVRVSSSVSRRLLLLAGRLRNGSLAISNEIGIGKEPAVRGARVCRLHPQAADDVLLRVLHRRDRAIG